jgi:streptogramin lyase
VAGAPIRAGDRYASSIAVGEGAVWVQEPRAGRLLKIDPKTGIVVARVASGSGRKLAVGGGAVWVLDDAAGTLQRIDPKKGQPVGPPAPVVSQGGGGIAVGENAAWVFSTDGNVVTRVGF